jgi:hypothetical protein
VFERLKKVVCSTGPDNPRNSGPDVARVADSRLLLVYERFAGELPARDYDTACIASKVSENDGYDWDDGDLLVTAPDGAINVNSPSLTILGDRKVLLTYAARESIGRQALYAVRSNDAGTTWSAPLAVTDPNGFYSTHNATTLRISTGRILLPAARWHNVADDPMIHNQVTFDGLCYYSDDEGESWHAGQPLIAEEFAHPSEGTLAESADGSVVALVPSGMGAVHRSVSTDGGQTWSEASPTELVCPPTPVSMARIPEDGRLVVFWHPLPFYSKPKVKKNAGYYQRTPLVSAISSDEGLSWSNWVVHEKGLNRSYEDVAIRFIDGSAFVPFFLCRPDALVVKLTRMDPRWLTTPSSPFFELQS